MNFDEILEGNRRQMKAVQSMVTDALNVPLEKGMMDKKTHIEFKKDMDKYAKFLTEGRTKEAESFLKKITQKHDKTNV